MSDVKKAVDNMPDSPARDGMESKLSTLDEETQKLPAQSEHLAQALAHVKQMMSQQPDAAPALQPFFDHVTELDGRATQERKDIDRQIAQSEKNLGACDIIDQATEGLKAVPQMIAIGKRPFDFAVDFFTNLATTAAPPDEGGMIAAGGRLASGVRKTAGK